ncbi:DNA-binding protein HU |uniref:DNA-binding protein HU \
MTKAKFIELVQNSGEFSSKAEAQNALKAVTDSIIEVLKNKDSISLIGFGTFSTVEVKEKSGIVPGSKKTYTKPAHIAPKFKISQGLKDIVAQANQK